VTCLRSPEVQLLRWLVNAPKGYVAIRLDHVDNGHHVGPARPILKAREPVDRRLELNGPAVQEVNLDAKGVRARSGIER